MYLDDDRRRTMTPQLAWRVAVIGGIALVAFAVIFFRLWYLQVLSGDKYERAAQDNQLRSIKVQAPRGEIVDRDGRVLVDNRAGLAIVVSPDKLPEDADARRAVYRRLSPVIGVSAGRIERRVERELKAEPYATAAVKQDVRRSEMSYVLEHKEDFPGIEVERVFLRQYPHHQVGAHLFGIVGEMNEEQRDDQRYRGVALGDRIGQSGIEYQYDRFLRGRNGASEVQVDALGNLKREIRTVEPTQGRQLRLSVDLGVQAAGQKALAGGTGKGAFVAMNVKNGEVLALGSAPSFDPNLFSKAVPASAYKRINSEEAGKPIVNRAIQGGYPTGSTFKLITATAALEGGLITPDTVQYDPGSLRVGGVTFRNAGGAVNGALALRKALSVSSDVFFYKLGLEANGGRNPLLIQQWANRLGLGRLTGIDLPEELAGRIPTPRWRNDLFRKKLTDRPWSVGDNINLSVGQGDLAADPLQMAVAYATIANGGRVVTPRLGQRIEDAAGRPVQQLQAPALRRLPIDPAYRQGILEGLRSAASEAGGTSAAVFKGFPVPVAGKTGTAEKGAGRADQSWYVALAPFPDPKYVVAVTDEAGGFGAETAAPMARQILQALFDVKQKGPIPTGDAPD
jgi:penicillin-binding protein 2